MMGDRDYRSTITGAIDAITRETESKVEKPDDAKTIYLHEITRCMRRSYYDRFDRLEQQSKGFANLFGGLIRKLPYGSKEGEFAIDEIKLKGQPDMIVDDIVIIFRTISSAPETPFASDILYINGCMWMTSKQVGVIIYVTGDGNETSFVVSREKKMFEEAIRRVRVFSNLIGEKKVPILEPSAECLGCQYYERCYIKRNEGKQFNLAELFSFKNK